MSEATNRAWERAREINPETLITVVAREDERAFVARFSSDEGLRRFNQDLITYPDGSFGLVILTNGKVPEEAMARRIIQPETAMDEEIVVTARMIYTCPAEARLSDQSDMIHADLCRLLDADETLEVACGGITIAHLATEAETYGNVEPSNVPAIQADRMSDALAGLFPDTDCDGERLRDALCDLRHFADARGLDFSLCDQTAAQHHAAEQGRGAREATLAATTNRSSSG